MYDFNKIWVNVEAALRSENYTFGEIHLFKEKWQLLEIDLMKPDNLLVDSARDSVKRIFDEVRKESSFASWNARMCLEKVYEMYFQNDSKKILDEQYVKTIILSVLYE